MLIQLFLTDNETITMLDLAAFTFVKQLASSSQPNLEKCLNKPIITKFEVHFLFVHAMNCEIQFSVKWAINKASELIMNYLKLKFDKHKFLLRHSFRNKNKYLSYISDVYLLFYRILLSYLIELQ